MINQNFILNSYQPHKPQWKRSCTDPTPNFSKTSKPRWKGSCTDPTPNFTKTSLSQNLKTSISQNFNVSKPQYLKTSIPQCHDDPVSDLLHDNQSILITLNPITESQITIISFLPYNSSINKIHPTMQFPEIF